MSFIIASEMWDLSLTTYFEICCDSNNNLDNNRELGAVG